MKRLFYNLSAAAFVLVLSHGSSDQGTQTAASTLLANHQIYNAAFNDVSPGFDDLYMIRTQDKGREIVIYCNAAYCYKNRNAIMTS